MKIAHHQLKQILNVRTLTAADDHLDFDLEVPQITLRAVRAFEHY